MLSIETNNQANLVRKLSVLFVEDDDEVRDSMARYLSRRIDTVHTAHNGKAGLRMFMEQHPDLVISDIRMSGMDGLAMCRAIRETEPELPVILISAHNESDVLLSSIDLGVVKFIVKPVDTNVLMDAIGNVAQSLEQRRDLSGRLRQMNLIQDETDYENECVKSYVSRYLESDRHEEIDNIRYLNIPKLGVSGDFFSVAKHRDDLYVMLADGAGHGLSAVLPALQMPRIFQQQAERGFSLLTIATELNSSLYQQRITGHFVATTLIRINACEQTIEVLNCGNPPVLIFDEAGVLHHTCHSRSTALGMLGAEEFSADVERFSLGADARIYVFSDGLTDTLQASEPDFDMEKLRAMLAESATGEFVGDDDFVGASLLAKRLRQQAGSNIEREALGGFDAVAAKVRAVAPHCKVDDVTLLEIRVKPETASATQIEIPFAAELQQQEELPVAMDQMTMLYVEDDDVTRDYLALYLNRRVGRVHVAKDGKEGLALFRKHRPQIVLSDIKMPNMDGLTMAEEIRKLDKDVPIIVISGSDNAEDAERMFEMGISRFHMKPLDTGRLTNTIQACLRQSGVLERLRLAASAFQASTLAVVTADRSKRIVAVNEAFTRITGYPLAEVFGHSFTLLSSGIHDANYFAAMWHALDESGSWSGELQCQHKDGTTVAEWLTVDALKGEDGALSGYHFIFSDIAERRMNEVKALELVSHDRLTHLPNRAMFADMVNERVLQGGSNTGGLALAIIKLDRFIDINNMLGVRVGDEVILAVAQRLSASVEAADAVCRTGGVEFAVLMREEGGREAIEREVAALSDVMSRPFDVNGQQISLRASIGVSLFPADGATYEELVRSASSAIDQARQVGGGVYRFFDQSLGQRKVRQIVLQQSIPSGLQRKEFYMLYQPKYSLGRKRVVGAEALVRWAHPTFGLISPVEFIPLAESSGSVIEMSEWIIDSVCAQLAAWRGGGLATVPVSINISPVHFWRGDLVASLQSALQKWDIKPSMLPIEVTEGVMIDTSERTLQILGRLKALGFHLSIDDFGTGYSSLKYLKDMPVSELKIDRSFIIEISEEGQPDDISRTAIPRAIIQLAAEFNLTVVAEGVETENQKNFLIDNGCDVIQGYLFSKPVSAEDFAVLLP